VDTAGEFGTEPDGKVWLFESGVQYQASNRLQLLAEGTLFEAQRPDVGERASGLGDTELTLSWLAAGARGALPSVVLGAKVKLPTATHDEIGSGKADYSALLILGRESGELELSVETEFATFGQVGDERLKEQFLYTINAEYGLNDYFSVYGELFGNSAPTASESRTDAARIGLEVDIPVSERVAPYVSLEIDTESVGTVRAGVEWTW